MLKVSNRSIISDKTPHTNKGRFYRYTFDICNVTARDVLLFIITTRKSVDLRQFYPQELFQAPFICSFLIVKISQLESHLCRLP